MGECPFEKLIGAYHDAELDPHQRELVEQHLVLCPQCREEAQSLRGLSGMFAAEPVRELTLIELSRIRRNALSLMKPAGTRFAWGLLAVAASILIVAGAWLMELTPGGQTKHMATGDAPEWERVAMTLRVEPLLPSQDDPTALADARLVDWMLSGLAGGRVNADH